MNLAWVSNFNPPRINRVRHCSPPLSFFFLAKRAACLPSAGGVTWWYNKIQYLLTSCWRAALLRSGLRSYLCATLFSDTILSFHLYLSDSGMNSSSHMMKQNVPELSLLLQSNTWTPSTLPAGLLDTWKLLVSVHCKSGVTSYIYYMKNSCLHPCRCFGKKWKTEKRCWTTWYQEDSLFKTADDFSI